MAACKASTIAPGVARVDFVIGYHLYGTKTALLAANLGRPEWFSDGRKVDKRGRTQRTVRGIFEGRRFKCLHRARTDDYQLTFRYVGAEREAREQEWQTSTAQRRQLEQAAAQEQRRLADLPRDHEAYRSRVTNMAESIVDVILTLAGDGVGGYRYSDDAMEGVESALDALADALALGEIKFSPDRKRAEVDSIRVGTAKADAGLQAFIALAAAGAQKPA